MATYYNESDPKAAAWLRELITAGFIAPGHVDERDIRLVRPSDIEGFEQCHFFAGIGGWSCALRLAGWPDDKPVWTGSCPCQPFSLAGKRLGTADSRHLWPQFRRLIRKCRPTVVFGEQVANADGRKWLASVFADMEALGYPSAGADLCAAGVGAPHIRQRLYWVGVTNGDGWKSGGASSQAVRYRRTTQSTSGAGYMANDCGSRLEVHGEQQARRQRAPIERGCETSVQGNAGGTGGGRNGRAILAKETQSGCERQAVRRFSDISQPASFWSDCQWVYCRDGKWRPTEPGSFPLAHGVHGRVGLLRGYGNAIVPQVAAEFVKAYSSI